MQFAPIEKITTAGAVERKLRTDILSGRIAAGSKLLPERELAHALGVNRLTLRSALARLASSGLIVSLQGDGNRVLDYRVNCGLERLPDLVDALDDDPAVVEKLVSDLLGLRRAISAEAVALAAQRATQEDVQALRSMTSEQAGHAGDAQAFLDGDLRWTREILRIADNLAFQLAFNTVVQFAKSHAELLRLIYAPPEIHLRGYEAMIALIEGGDPALAREQVRTGLELLDATFIARVREHLTGR